MPHVVEQASTGRAKCRGCGAAIATSSMATVLVMIDNPKGAQYYGAAVAGPVFKEITQALIKRYNLPKN